MMKILKSQMEKEEDIEIIDFYHIKMNNLHNDS